MKKATLIILSVFLVSSIYSQYYRPVNQKKVSIMNIEKNIDSLYKTMKKINRNKDETKEDKNRFISLVLKKDRLSEKISNELCEYMQKYIKKDDRELNQKLAKIHSMLNLLFTIKNSIEINKIKDLQTEFLSFKKICKKRDRKPSRRRCIRIYQEKE